jgi:hypothetical protein
MPELLHQGLLLDADRNATTGYITYTSKKHFMFMT